MLKFATLLTVGCTFACAAPLLYDIRIPAAPSVLSPGGPTLATNAVEIQFTASTLLTSTLLNLQSNPAGISGFTVSGSPLAGSTLTAVNFNSGPGDMFVLSFQAGPLAATTTIFAPPGEHFDHVGVYNVANSFPNQLLMGTWAAVPPPPSDFFSPTLVIASVPEPTTLSTITASLIALLALAHRRSRS